MNENEDLISRLRSLGRRPVDTGLATRHLAAMAVPSQASASRRPTHRLRIVAAFAVGLLAGTSGLATAGALPNGAQEIAHTALGSVGVNVPHGDRYQGPECGGVVKNHGQYVRSQPKGSRATAAASPCGKPLQAGNGDDQSGDGNGDAPGKAAGCQGPPPWAGKGKPDQAAKDARKQACGDEKAGDEKAGDDKAGDDKAGDDKAGDVQKPAGSGKVTPDPAAGTVKEPVPATTSTSATTSTTVTMAPTSTTVTTAPEEDTTSTTAAVPVPGLGS
jgi:hypothetical protein